MQTLRKGPVFNAPILKIKDMNATVLKTLEKKWIVKGIVLLYLTVSTCEHNLFQRLDAYVFSFFWKDYNDKEVAHRGCIPSSKGSEVGCKENIEFERKDGTVSFINYYYYL